MPLSVNRQMPDASPAVDRLTYKGQTFSIQIQRSRG